MAGDVERPHEEAAQAPAPDRGPLLDRTAVDRLVGQIGRPEIVARTLRTYDRLLPERVEAVATAFTGTPWTDATASIVADAVHTLSGPSETFGVAAIGRWCRSVERRLAGSTSVDRLRWAAELTRLAEATRTALHPVIEALEAGSSDDSGSAGDTDPPGAAVGSV